MKRSTILLGLTATLVACLCHPLVGAEEDVMQARLQRVFSALSQLCQEEIQQSYTGGTSEVSDACKTEYQQAMANDLQENPPSQVEAEVLQKAAQGGASSSQAGGEKEEKKVRDLSEEPDPTPYIIGFVVIFLSSIGGYIFYVNSKLPPQRKRKKLSKKKELKKKRQEQNIRGK